MTRAFVVERLPRRAPVPPPAALPEPVKSALGSIADDLRHAPRDVFLDRAELVHWLNRLARRVDGVSAMTASTPQRESPLRPRHRHTAIGRAVTPRDIADAVFGTSTPIGPAKPRTITSRKGKPVRVEVRRRRHDVPAQLSIWEA